MKPLNLQIINRPLSHLLSFLLFSLYLAGCSDMEIREDPADAPDTGVAAPATRSILLPTSANTVYLFADGVTDTHELMKSKGYNPGEDPYFYPANHYGVKHMSQVYDETLGKYVFKFDIHVDHDIDKDGTTTTKQRVELKTDSGSPENMRGELGDTHIYKWKFKLPLGMQVSKQFCYIHQLKTIGGDDSHPVIAMRLGQVTNTPDRFQLIHVGEPEDGNKFTYLANVNMSEMLGEWVEVTERATYRDDGAYECLIVRLSDNKVLVDVRVDDIDLWRTPQCQMVRPKYGIYRGIEGDVKSELRDETLLFADFELTEIKNVRPTVSLIADGVTDTHSLITSKGFDVSDDPYYHANNHTGVKHINQVFDNTLGKYVFKFDIHLERDRDQNSTGTTRQRVEMKTNAASPSNMRGEKGDTHIYSFKFKLPEGMEVSQQYCYIHQLNPVGGDTNQSPITMGVRKVTNNPDKFQLLHIGGPETGNKYTYLAQVDLSEMTGHWMEVTQHATFDDNGSYYCKIVRLTDDKVMVEYRSGDIDLWRSPECQTVCPRFGIYRGTSDESRESLRDETVLFADFELTEISAK